MADETKQAPPETLGRFGHHKDPVMDFAIEVFEIEAEVAGTIDRKALEERIARAMEFRGGSTIMGVAAKRALWDAKDKFERQRDQVAHVTNWHVIKLKNRGLVTMTTTLDVGPLLFPSNAAAQDYADKSRFPADTVEILPARLRVWDSIR